MLLVLASRVSAITNRSTSVQLARDEGDNASRELFSIQKPIGLVFVVRERGREAAAATARNTMC